MGLIDAIMDNISIAEKNNRKGNEYYYLLHVFFVLTKSYIICDNPQINEDRCFGRLQHEIEILAKKSSRDFYSNDFSFAVNAPVFLSRLNALENIRKKYLESQEKEYEE